MINRIKKGMSNKCNNEDKEFYKNDPDDLILWVDNRESVGQRLFSFDKVIIFNMFRDYPFKLTKEQIEIFDRENPH